MTPEQAAQKYHWVKYNSTTNTIELYLDHYMLSNARLCEARFYMSHLLHINPRYDTSHRKPWFLDFGEFVHYCLETFYKSFKLFKRPPDVTLWLEDCKQKWISMKMEEYGEENNPHVFPADKKKFEDVEGWPGVSGLLIQYFSFYMDMRLRVIDTEITFGHNKEVFLGTFNSNIIRDKYLEEVDNYIGVRLKVECYLTGRIDLLVDNGYKIGPIDHKTTHRFDGMEHTDFNPQDGITGYILAINELLKEYQSQGISCPFSSGGWIFHISNTTPSTPRDKTKKPGPRFKTTPIDKTKEQLDDFKARQLSTFKRIAELLFNDKVPEWNTTACNNIFMRPCEYKPIHEQPSSEWSQIINNHYTVGQHVWDTREHGQPKTSNNEEVKQ